MLWVQLTSMQNVTEHGIQKTCHPGDWVKVGRQTALLWVSRGEARLADPGKYASLGTATGSGIVIISEGDAEQLRAIGRAAFEAYPNMEIAVSPVPDMPYKYNVLWQPGAKLRLELIPIGLSLLETWQVAMPLADYEQLACHLADEDERERTAKVLPDMRMPLYSTGLMFVKRDKDTERLFAAWGREMENGGDAQQAFIRALYRNPLLILALPVTWTGKDVRH